MRSISYRSAATAFVFTACWFVFGLFLLWTPIPHALGIHGGMFVVWALLFFAILALSGATLVIAAYNAAFPPVVRAPSRAESLWTAGGGTSAASGRTGAGTSARSSSTHRG